jgi:hypothetical protein
MPRIDPYEITLALFKASLETRKVEARSLPGFHLLDRPLYHVDPTFYGDDHACLTPMRLPLLRPDAPEFTPAQMHGGYLSIPRVQHDLKVHAPALDSLAAAFGAGTTLNSTGVVSHEHTQPENRPFSLSHTLTLDPQTRSHFEMVGGQVVCSAAHLMMHTTLKGVIFTILEFLYKTCSPLLTAYSPSSIMTDHVWPLIEQFSNYLASKVRNDEDPTPPGRIRANQDSFTAESWMDMIPLGAGLASIVAALITGNCLTASASGLKEYKKWTDYGAGLGKIKTAITTVTEFAHWIVEHTRSLMLAYYPDASISTSMEQQFLAHGIDISKYMRDAVALTNPNNSDKVLRDPATPKLLVDLVQISSQILVLDATAKVAPGASARNALGLIRRELMTFAQSFSSSRAADAKRPTPFHISLFGKSGVGKSDMVNSFINDLTNPDWFPTVVDRGEDGNVSVYPRSATDPYWSNYAGQTAVILDDFGQSAQDTVADSEYLSLIFLKSGVAYMPRMAAVSDKGRLFTSRLIVSTTNVLFPTSHCVLTPEALWRRRDILVEVEAKPNTQLDDPDHLIFSLIDPCPAYTGKERTTPMRIYLKKNLSYAQLIEYCVPRLNAFCARDERAVLRKTGLTDENVSALASRLVAPVVTREAVPECLPARQVPPTEPLALPNPFRPPPLPRLRIAGIRPRPEPEAEFEEEMATRVRMDCYLRPEFDVEDPHLPADLDFPELEEELPEPWLAILNALEAVAPFPNCECCGEPQTNEANICCTQTDHWHPQSAGVPAPIYASFTLKHACASFNTSRVTPEFFHHDWTIVNPFHVYAVFQAIQVRDIVMDFNSYDHFPLKTKKGRTYRPLAEFTERLHAKTEGRLRLPEDDSLPVPVLWSDMRAIWIYLKTLRKQDLYHWCEPTVPPRTDPTYTALWHDWNAAEWLHDDEPTYVDMHALEEEEPLPTVAGLSPEAQDTVRLLTQALHERDRNIIYELPAPMIMTILTSGSPNRDPRILTSQLMDCALIRRRRQRTVQEMTLESAALDPETILANATRERQTSWLASPKVSPILKLVFGGLGVAAAAFVTWKVYKWLSTDTHTISTSDANGNVEEVKCVIKKNYKGYARDILLNALGTAAIASASLAVGRLAGVAADMESFGYDGRARFLRQGRVLRTAQHDLQESVADEVEKVIGLYATELKDQLSPEAIEEFKVAARVAVTKAFRKKANQDGTSDNRTSDIIDYKFKKSNALLASRRRISGKVSSTNGFGLKGKLALFPFHLFHDLPDGETTTLTVRSPKGVYDVNLTMGKHIRRTTASSSVHSEDLALVFLGMRVPSFHDVTKHFCSEEDVASMHSTPATVLSLHPTSHTMTQHVAFASRDDQAIEYGDEHSQYLLPRHWTYNVSSYPGMCGSSVHCLNNQSSGCIMGMHTAGLSNVETSYAAIVTREWLEEQLAKLFPIEAAQHCGPTAVDGPLTLGLEPDLDFSDWTTSDPPRYPTIQPEGQVSLAAYLSPKSSERVTAKTDLRPSPLFDLVEPHQTEPAVLHPKDPRLEAPVSPMNEGAKKYAIATVPQNPTFIANALMLISATLLCYIPTGLGKRVLTIDEGINGVPAAGFARINPLTSPGLPYKRWKPAFAKGKRFLFDCTNENTDRLEMRLKDKYLSLQLVEYHQQLLRGEQAFILSYSNLKDERRSLAKVSSGATRLFDCMPLHYNIECRRFFGAFIACMNQNCTKLPSAVGLNPLGPDWTALYNRLNRFGGKVIAGDYKAWDGKLDPDVMYAAVQVINEWYDDGPENARARITLVEQMIHLYTVYGNVVTLKSQGIPSGVPITADMNGLCNWFYILIALQSIAVEKGIKLNMDDLSDQLELLFYGDDHVIAPSAEIREWFSFHDVQRYFTSLGMGYTDAQKKGGEQPAFLNLADETTFLKRTFSPHPTFRTRILAPIETKTIYEEINWLRATPTVEHERDAMYQNLTTVFSEAYHHGSDFYTSLQNKVNDCLSLLREADLRDSGSSQWRSLTTGWDYHNELWLDTFA